MAQKTPSPLDKLTIAKATATEARHLGSNEGDRALVTDHSKWRLLSCFMSLTAVYI